MQSRYSIISYIIYLCVYLHYTLSLVPKLYYHVIPTQDIYLLYPLPLELSQKQSQFSLYKQNVFRPTKIYTKRMKNHVIIFISNVCYYLNTIPDECCRNHELYGWTVIYKADLHPSSMVVAKTMHQYILTHMHSLTALPLGL